MTFSLSKLSALVIAVTMLASAGLAYNQMTVYTYDDDGRSVDGVTITVEGVNNDYYEQKTTSSNNADFYGYTAGEEYRITAEENNGDRSGEKTVVADSDEPVWMTMSGDESGNSDPSLTLENPDADATGVALQPQFEWSATDPDNDDLEYEFYIEEKSYSSDRPWTAEPETTSDTTLTPDNELDENTEYVWGVKAKDGNGGTDREYRYFTTGDGESNQDPSVDLEDPDADETGVSRQPEFRWEGTDPDNDDLEYRFYLEKKSYSSDRPWSAEPEETSDESYTPPSQLDPDEEYVWGVEVDDGNGGTDREYRYFTTEEEQQNRDPDVDLQNPDADETGVVLQPEFWWTGSDPDGDSLEYDFYLEEKSYSGDRPWSDTPETTSDTELTPSNELDHDTEYVWGVKARDGNGGSDREYRYFTTEEEEQQNRDPSVDLTQPDADETGVSLSPVFRWTASDPDNDDLEYRFYLEEKSYSGDRPWSDTPEHTTDTVLNPNYNFQYDTEYVWGVKALDGNGGSDREYRYFTTEEEEQQNRDPDVDLDYPQASETGVSLQPQFEWHATDPDNDDLDYELYVEERTYDDDRPWSASPVHTSRTSYTLDYRFDRNTEYVWGVKAEDGNGGVDREYRYFTTRSGASECDVSVSDISISDTNIDEGESTDVSFTVHNNGDSQDFRVRLKVGSQTVMDRDVSLDEGESRDFDRPISPSSDSVVKYIVETEGSPCGYSRYVDSDEVYVDPGDGGDNEPDADFSYTPSNPEPGTQVQFTSTSTDPDDDITGYRWRMDDGTTKYGSSVTHSYSSEGSYDVQLRVEDSEGNYDYKTRTVNVESPAGECDISTGSLELDPENVEEGEAVDASITVHNDGDDQTVQVRIVGTNTYLDQTREIDEGEHGTFSTSFTPSGTQVVQAVVETQGEPCGYSQTVESGEVQVSDPGEEPEEPTASFTWRPTSPDAGESVEFTSTSTDPDSDITEYNWNFGDGSSASGSTVTHTFDSEGEYPVQLQVEDSEGNTDSVTRDVEVGARYTECSYSVSDLSLSRQNIERGESSRASVTISNDGDRQQFRVWYQVDGQQVSDRTITINGGEQRTVSTFISPTRDSVVQGVVESQGEPCGYQQTVKPDEIYVSDPGPSEDDAELRVVARDENGDRTNAHARVENSETRSGYLGSDGERTFSLEPDTYDVRVSKDNYNTQTRTVHLSEGESETLRFDLRRGDSQPDPDRDIEITSIDYPDSVCRGDSFRVYATVRNNDNYDMFTMTGEGPASGGSNTFALSEGNSITRSLRFTNVQGTGDQDFTVRVENGDVDSRSFTVDVEDCTAGTPSTGTATSISMNLQERRIVAGDSVKVTGYVDGARGRSEVEISANGDRKARVSTQPDGYFQTFIRMEEVGMHSISASSGDQTAYRELEVVPTASANFQGAPRQVFQGEEFELCAGVNSQVEPDVLLLEDGKIIQSKKASGNVCFDVTASGTGDRKYEVRALTYGTGASDTTEIEVLETDVEATSFPDQIASVESGSGLVKVELYNTHDGVKRYDLSLQGIDRDWVSQSEKQVVLEKGERRTVYFYLTPKQEGVYNPEVVVETEGSEIYRNQISVTAGGTYDGERKRNTVFDSVRRVVSFLTF
jgi:PKD repeat protein